MKSQPSKQAKKGFSFAGKTYKIVAMSQLRVDKEYQRQLSWDQKALSDKKAKYKERAVRALTVSLRKDGFYWIVDGQHRYELMKSKGEHWCACEVHEGLTKAQESELFLELNDVKTVAAKDKFKANYFAGNDAAVGIMRVVKEHGFIISFDKKKPINALTCVSAIEKIAKGFGIEVLSDVLYVITKAFGIDESIVQQAAKKDLMLSGLANFIGNNANVDADEIVSALMGLDAEFVLETVEEGCGACRKDAISHFHKKYLPNLLYRKDKAKAKAKAKAA